MGDEIKLNINSVYNSDEFSETCPGKNVCASLKIDGKRGHVQKCLVLLNLKELHTDYLKRYENTLGFSKFLRVTTKKVYPCRWILWHTLFVHVKTI